MPPDTHPASPTGELIIRFDGDGVHPHSMVADRVLEFVGTFTEVMRRAAETREYEVTFTGLELRDKCAEFVLLVGEVEYAVEAAQDAVSLMEQSELPKGLGEPVKRARRAFRALPRGYSASLMIDAYSAPLGRRPTPGALMPWSQETFRARPMRAGGTRPAVRFSANNGEKFTLSATEEIAKDFGHVLYEDVLVRALISRHRHNLSVHSGEVQGFTRLNDAEPTTAWQEWFASHADDWADVVDIEHALGR